MRQLNPILFTIVTFLSIIYTENSFGQYFTPNFGAMRRALNTANNNYERGFEQIKSHIDSINDIKIVNKYNIQKRNEQNKKLELTYNDWGNRDLAIPSNFTYVKGYIDYIFYSHYIEEEYELLVLIGHELHYRNCRTSSNSRCEELLDCLSYLENCELSDIANIKQKFKLSNIYKNLNSY
jgi:hypothetical protein